MRPPDDRIGRRLANGRFEVVESIGTSEFMGVSIAIDARDGARVRTTISSDVVATSWELKQTLVRDVRGLAPIVYLGEAAADDGWGSDFFLMAERLPSGRQLDSLGEVGGEAVAAKLGGMMVRTMRDVHRQGAVLGTLRPESTFVDGDTITFVARGERLWLLPKPNSSKVAAVPPWPPGYWAPELWQKLPIIADPDPAADVYSLGAMIGELLIRSFPFERASYTSLMLAQMKGEHVPLPDTRLGRALTRALSPDPEGRPSLDELAEELAQ